MKAINILMNEHRLIERMLKILEKEVIKIQETNKVDLIFIDTIVDFFTSYTHRHHHGKEEEVLFKRLVGKNLPENKIEIMEKLIHEHQILREEIGEIVRAKQKFIMGEKEGIEKLIENFTSMIDYYPKHIKIEDLTFFPSIMKVFTDAEKEELYQAFLKFDQNMEHQKYQIILEQLEKQN